MHSVQIDIISDLVCPWCYIGRKRLAKAVALLPDLETRIRWQPFELFPAIPLTGTERHTQMTAVFGSAQRRDGVFTQVAEAGRAEGLDLRFDTIPVSPNTFALHRLLWKADQEGFQDELAEALFHAFFTDNRDLTQADQLSDLLEPFGWSPAQTRQFLASDEGREITRDRQRLYRYIGITSVPTYIFNNQLTLVGAQPPEQFARAINRAAALPPVPVDGLPSHIA